MKKNVAAEGGLPPTHYTNVYGQPATLTDVAWEKIMRSGAQGSIFPQALVEVFGQAGVFAKFYIDCVAKNTIFPGAEEDEQIYVLGIVPEKEPKLSVQKGPYIAYINASDLAEQRMGGHRGFSAVDTAKEQLRLFKLYYEMR